MYRLPLTARTLAARALGLLALALLLDPRPAAAQAPDLHVVIVADTDDPNIGPGCYRDLANVKALFEKAPGNRRVTLKVFAGKTAFPGLQPVPNNFNQKAIKDYLASIPLGPNTGVLVYYTGHGDYTTKEGHRMVIPAAPGDTDGRMPNEDVIRAVGARKTSVRMIAVITDSCCPNVGDDFTRKPAPKPPTITRAPFGRRTLDVIDDLFYKPGPTKNNPAAALLDINGAAENELAFGPADTGGFFTVAFTDTIRANSSSYVDDANGDGVLTWYEVLPGMIDRTKKQFDDANKQARAAGQPPLPGPDGKPQKSQTPQPFRLPDPGPGFKYPYTVGVDGVANPGGGLRVTKVSPGGPAEDAGLQPGDIIRKANGRSVRNFYDFAGIVDFARSPKLELLVERGGKLETVAVMMKEN